MTSDYDAALFDMDGLLLDTELIVNQGLHAAADHFNLQGLEQTFLDMIGFRGADSQAILEHGLDGRVSSEVFREKANVLIKAQLAKSIPVKNQVRKLLQHLSENQIPCAVASSTQTVLVEQQLTRSDIRQFFKTVTGGDQVVNGKPDPEIYFAAASSLGVDASRCAAFEDSGPGTLAAIASGATVVQVPDMIKPDAQLRSNGHVIAVNIWEGAQAIGLV